MLYIVLAYLMLFAALTNSVCLNNASFFFFFKYFLCQGYELSGEIALKNNHYKKIIIKLCFPTPAVIATCCYTFSYITMTSQCFLHFRLFVSSRSWFETSHVNVAIDSIFNPILT